MDLYDFIGEDMKSAFKGKGKVGPIKICTKTISFIGLLVMRGQWILIPLLIQKSSPVSCLLTQEIKISTQYTARCWRKRLEKIKASFLNLRLTFANSDHDMIIYCRVNHRLTIFKRAGQPHFKSQNHSVTDRVG